MPGKWGGARRARPPLDPPMQFSQMFTKAKNIESEKFILITEVNLGKKILIYFCQKNSF